MRDLKINLSGKSKNLKIYLTLKTELKKIYDLKLQNSGDTNKSIISILISENIN